MVSPPPPVLSGAAGGVSEHAPGPPPCEYAIYVKALIKRANGELQESLTLFQAAPRPPTGQRGGARPNPMGGTRGWVQFHTSDADN